MKPIKTISLLLFLSTFLIAQERMILRTNGEQIKINAKKDLREAITESIIKRSDGKVFTNQIINSPSNINGVVDTMNYRSFGGSWNTNFGFFGQDVMLMWFEAPADMIIEAIGFTCSDDTGAENATLSLRLIKLNWTKEQLKNFVGDKQIGYFPSDADGMNNIDYFGEMATGSWVSKDVNNPLPPWTDNEDPALNTFDYDMWSDAGYDWPIMPVASPSTDPVYLWDDSRAGYGISVSQGEMFAIVATHDGINLDSDRIGFWSDNSLGYPGWKYYENGRTDSAVDQGWWVRQYTWDFAVAVDIISSPYLVISEITQVPTSLSKEPRKINATVRDANPTSGTEGISEVNLMFNVSDGDTQTLAMEHIGDNIYEAYIPHSECSEIEYWIEVIDINNYKSESQSYSYWLYCPSKSSLLVLNGFDSPSGYPQEYYFGPEIIDYRQEMDIWAYGPLTKELVDNYKFIVENCTAGPNDDNRKVIREWFASEDHRVYMLWGQEWLRLSAGGFGDELRQGDFEYDILGIKGYPYNDISYDGFSGQELPSRFFPQEGTALGGPMFDLVAKFNTSDSTKIDSVLYDPISEISTNNWLDGFDVRTDDPNLEVFMKAETRGIMGAPVVRDVNVGVSRNVGRNHMTVFMSYDPISINSSPYNYWFGRSSVSSQMQAIRNLPLEGDVEDGDLNNIKFSLSQNYPNPFNPSTIIKYSVPTVDEYFRPANTTLKIYDILGREVATLVNKEQKPGNYEVNFDGKGLTSGIYFYKLTSGNFIESKKMLLIK